MKTNRINMVVNDDIKALLNELKNDTKARSLTDVFVRSLAVYKMLVDAQNEGHALFVHEKNGEIKHEIKIIGL